MVPKKLFAVLIIPILLIPLAAYGYAHWTDTVFKKYKFHFRFPGEIGTYKVLYEFNETGTMVYHSKAWMTITLSCENIFTGPPDWYLWVGLMIQNTEETPMSLTGPIFTPQWDPDGIWPNFTEDTYFYGIFPQPGYNFTQVYKHVKLPPLGPQDIAPPPPGYWGETPPPPRPTVPHMVDIPPLHRIVIWTRLSFPGVDGSPIDFTISFTFT